MKAKQRTRPVTASDVQYIEAAERALRHAATILRFAQANNAANYVRRALKSTQGALRHAQGRLSRG